MSLLRRHWHYIAIVLLTVLFYFPLVLPGTGLPAGGDFFAFHTPYRVFTSLKLHQGTLPLYAHEMFGGYPIFQDPQFALFYPVNFLYGLAVADAASQTALDVYVLINLILLSLSSLFFIRSFGLRRMPSLIGAAAASFNGFIVVHVTHINMIQVLTMSLFAAGFLSRFTRGGAGDIRPVLAAAIALAFGNLAGHPQTTMYTHYALAVGIVVLAVRHWQRTRVPVAAFRIMAGAALAVILGLMLATVQLVPTAELLRISTRASVSRAEVLWSGLDLIQLPSVIFPGLYMRLPWSLEWPPYYHSVLPEDPRAWFAWLDNNFSEGYAAMGAAAFVLGLIGWFSYWRSWPVQVLAWGSLFVLGASVGDDLPFYGLLYDTIPGFRLVRVSTRILLVFFPAWGLLAALGIQGILEASPARLRRIAIASFGTLVVLILLWLMWIARRHTGNWTDTWIRVLSGDEENYFGHTVLKRRSAEFFAALYKQIILAVFLLVTLALLLLIPIRRPRVRAAGLGALVALELTIYCFGWATAINYPGITSVDSAELLSIPPHPRGRVLNFTAPNTGLFMDRPVANGYSVTVDDWVTAFQPDATPPFRNGIQETYLDLWNVSDIITKRVPREALIGEQSVVIDDWGWTEIGAPWVAESGETSVSTRALMPSTITVDFPTTRPLKNLHLVAFSGRTDHLPDGTEIARVIALNAAGDALTSAPVLLGQHVSEARYPFEGTAAPAPAHSRARLSYYRITPNHWSSDVNFFDAELDLATNAPITSITLQASGPYATTLGLNHLAAVLSDGSFVIRDLLSVQGFDKVPSVSPGHRVLHRDRPPGYARMVPTAVAGSYKASGNIMWRMFNGDVDPLSTLIVDKRRINDDELRCVNAPHVPAFRGSAEIEWLSDRHGKVTTEANMHGWLFLSQTFDTGWSAEVDGEPAEIYRANGPFMGIPLTGGSHEIHLKYTPMYLVPAALISGLAALIVGALWVKAERRRRA